MNKNTIAFIKTLTFLLAGAVFGVACSVNPVTGEREFVIVSAAQEVEMGTRQYRPGQQSQGGRYVVDPDLTLYVNAVGQKLAAAGDRPQLPYEFVVLNNDVPNAWALPGGKIAVNRGLLIHLEDESQLAAVLSHEIIHAAARHAAQQMTQGAILAAGTQAVGHASQDSEYGELITTGVGIGAAAWQARYGRQQELDSDYHGMNIMSKVGYDPRGAVELQETFVKLSEGRNQDWLSGLFASHPPSAERVQANREHAAKLPGSIRNKQQYQRAIAQLKRDQDAYDTHQQAIAALNDKDIDKALSLTNKAIDLQPNENLFWETKAHLLVLKGDKQQALDAYGRAIANNPEYFSPYLGRGSLNLDLKHYGEAEQDLLASKGLLDTQVVNFLLGEATLQQGKTQEALRYYQVVAQSGGELGQAANQRLTQLGVPLGE